MPDKYLTTKIRRSSETKHGGFRSIRVIQNEEGEILITIKKIKTIGPWLRYRVFLTKAKEKILIQGAKKRNKKVMKIWSIAYEWTVFKKQTNDLANEQTKEGRCQVSIKHETSIFVL